MGAAGTPPCPARVSPYTPTSLPPGDHPGPSRGHGLLSTQGGPSSRGMSRSQPHPTEEETEAESWASCWSALPRLCSGSQSLTPSSAQLPGSCVSPDLPPKSQQE